MSGDKSLDITISKADTERGLVFGWAIVCKKDGQPYYDLQGDYIPEDTMLDASMEYMRDSRAAGEMHKSAGLSFGDKKVSGQVLFAFPMTDDVQKAFGIGSDRTGLMVGAHITDQEALQKVKSGAYTGFSIEGKRLEQDLIGEDGNVFKTDRFDEVEKRMPKFLRQAGGDFPRGAGKEKADEYVVRRVMANHYGRRARKQRAYGADQEYEHSKEMGRTYRKGPKWRSKRFIENEGVSKRLPKALRGRNAGDAMFSRVGEPDKHRYWRNKILANYLGRKARKHKAKANYAGDQEARSLINLGRSAKGESKFQLGKRKKFPDEVSGSELARVRYKAASRHKRLTDRYGPAQHWPRLPSDWKDAYWRRSREADAQRIRNPRKTTPVRTPKAKRWIRMMEAFNLRRGRRRTGGMYDWMDDPKTRKEALRAMPDARVKKRIAWNKKLKRDWEADEGYRLGGVLGNYPYTNDIGAVRRARKWRGARTKTQQHDEGRQWTLMHYPGQSGGYPAPKGTGAKWKRELAEDHHLRYPSKMRFSKGANRSYTDLHEDVVMAPKKKPKALCLMKALGEDMEKRNRLNRMKRRDWERDVAASGNVVPQWAAAGKNPHTLHMMSDKTLLGPSRRIRNWPTPRELDPLGVIEDYRTSNRAMRMRRDYRQSMKDPRWKKDKAEFKDALRRTL